MLVELFFSVEPILTPYLLKQKIPLLVGASNFLVANCNFAVMYFFPLWFQTVCLTSASVAGTKSLSLIKQGLMRLISLGAHLLPNSLAMSTGSVFAGWVMHKTGKYKLLNLIFGFFPFIGATAICLINEDSGFIQTWFSIVRDTFSPYPLAQTLNLLSLQIPLGFGNAVVLQTMLSGYPADLLRIRINPLRLSRSAGPYTRYVKYQSGFTYVTYPTRSFNRELYGNWNRI